LGSRAYVAAHLRRGTPGYDKFDAYFNFDYGTGRIRGIYLEGNESAKPIFHALFAPFNDLGAATVSSASIGASDHISFDEIGLPGFQWIRDYMEGANTRAPHTNMDTYDHVLLDDLKQSAAVGAFIVYQLAMRGDKVPRKPHSRA
jgi:carboxypeptidase Q